MPIPFATIEMMVKSFPETNFIFGQWSKFFRTMWI